MTDRELLELAAKAADLGPIRWQAGNTDDGGSGTLPHNVSGAQWNPLTDDGDALRLAIQCEFDIVFTFHGARVMREDGIFAEEYGTDAFAAARRAIVKAAAKIGKQGER